MPINNSRVHFLDELRGFIVVLMVLYHATYDIAVFSGESIPLFNLPLLQWVHLCVACTFMLVSGVMCAYSRSNLHRGMLCTALALCITAVTHFFVPSQAIYFGVLHFLGFSMIIFALLQKLFYAVPPLLGIAVSVLLLLFTEPVGYGYLGFGAWEIVMLPPLWYSSNFLAPLGIFADGFFSADYYPLLPWFFVFLMGAYLGKYFHGGLAPQWYYKERSPLLAKIGKNALAVYVLHQPLLFLILYPLMRILAW